MYGDGLNCTFLMLVILPILIFFKSFVHFLGHLVKFFSNSYHCICQLNPIIPEWKSHFNEDWEWTTIIDENLGSFWECLPGLEQKRWYATELYLRNKLHIQPIVDKPSFESLRVSRRGHQCMASIFNYDILSNFRYTDIFFYHALDQRLVLNGNIDHKSSDVVSNVLKMGEKTYQTHSHRKP